VSPFFVTAFAAYVTICVHLRYYKHARVTNLPLSVMSGNYHRCWSFRLFKHNL